MEDTGKAVLWSLLLTIIVAAAAVFAYNQVVVKPEIASLNSQMAQLIQSTNQNAARLDKYAEVLNSLTGTVNRTAETTSSLAETVNNNAAVAN